MLAPVLKALTSRVAGPAASALAAVLAVALALTWTSSAHTRAQLEGRIAELSRPNAAPLVAFVASADAPEGLERTAGGPLPAAAASDKDAARLLVEPPAGFDDCARMQSADEAVRASLK